MPESKENDRHKKGVPFLLRAVRAYTFNFPIDRGKGKLFNLAKKITGDFSANVIAETTDGRRMHVAFRDWADEHIYFLGSYEPFCTRTIAKYIKPGSVCFDVGANIGWYTTLFQTLCGTSGSVHSFEPVPLTFAELRENVSLNSNAGNVHINNFGLADKQGNVDIFLFPGDPSGHASMSNDGNTQAIPVKISLSTLNSYVEQNSVDHVDVVKVDIEGAELMFLKGATRLFEQKTPPVILMEMSPETSSRFGYQPNDLIDFLNDRVEYLYLGVDENSKELTEFQRFEKDTAGKNVLCVPRGL